MQVTRALGLVAVAATFAIPAPAQEAPEGSDGGTGPDLSAATVIRHIRADTTRPRLRLGLAPVPLPFETSFGRRAEPPGTGHLWLAPARRDWGARWARRIEEAGAGLPARTGPVASGAGGGSEEEADTAAYLPPTREEREAARRRREGGGERPTQIPGEEVLPEVFQEYADLGMNIRGRAEFGGSWTRFQPCDPVLQLSCDPGLFPRLQPDIQFGVRVGGTISDRVHVNVDYDQTREFSAANNINIYYQGLEDEMLQRLEVGDVSFQLPRSRFLTQGIPSGNFGFRATGQVGPIDFETVWAQQKGDLSTREFTLGGVGSRQGFVQNDTLTVDDADYARGQFFFVVDPREVTGFPHIDILSLEQGAVPQSLAPGGDPIQLYRYQDDPVTTQQVEGFIQADAVASVEGDTIRDSGWFRQLQPGEDYFVHSSGLFVVLRSPLRREEMLAVTYVTATGDTVGDYNPERIHNAGGRPELRLLKAAGSSHQPGRPTWEQEMHQVYRVSGSNDVDLASVELTVSLGELSSGRTFIRGPAGTDITFLRFFGLDDEAPVDQVDRAHVYKPADETLSDQPPVSGTFVVFPTLRPFVEPPPLPSEGLTAAQSRELLGSDANRTIYETVDPFERENGGRFRLTMPYKIESQGIVSTVSLGAIGLRDGSEKIYLGERLLERGTDYEINYDIGQVTFTDPQGLFSTNPDARLRATYEQKPVFQIAPTSVFGMSAHYGLGETGDLNFMGLYQSEKTLTRRPRLGVEPASIFLGGLNGDLSFDAPWIDRALREVPGLRLGGSSRLQVRGELAMSMPNPNTRGHAFLDDFEATNEIRLPSVRNGWRRGSAPEFTEGAVAALPPALNASDKATMTWQHDWVVRGAEGDSAGIFPGFTPEQIDRQIAFAGTRTHEPALFVVFGQDTLRDDFDRRRWSSITSVLSTSGRDLTKSEFLEFYVAGGTPATLVLDLGVVSEDAFFVDENGEVGGVHPESGDPWGLGVLDQEVDPRQGEIWNDELDAIGLWNESCRARRGQVYPLGDPRTNCTRGNGLNDTEDLDGNGNLDTAERYLRYTIRLDGTSPYLVRDTANTGTSFRLYRIPIRGTGSTNVADLFTDADFRAVKHLRMTVTAEQPTSMIFSRMRIVGSRWVKRARDGVARGVGGDTAGTPAQVEVGPVSRITDGGAYSSPPGVRTELQDPTAAFGGGGTEFNEKSLRLSYESLMPGERAEVYNRFPQNPWNLLTYRQLRLWVAARRGDWGAERPKYFFLKVGTGPENFYLYRTRLEPAANPGGVAEDDWRPERIVDFEEWFALRSEAERRILEDPPEAGDPPIQIWSADSTYAVVLKDRARAPNLAKVRELALGVMNEGGTPVSGEVWIDELRVSDAVTEPGVAGFVDMNLQAADFLTTSFSFSNRGSLFRQLEGDATYQADRSWSVNTTANLDRMLPGGWNVDIPLTVSHSSNTRDPTFINQSDVRADRLENLREEGSDRTRLGLSFRKNTPSSNPLVSFLVDPVTARVGYTTNSSSTITSESESHGFDASLQWNKQFERHAFSLFPGFLGDAVRAILPGFLEEKVAGAELRWTPDDISMGTSYFDQENRSSRFEQILRLPSDTAVRPTVSPREGMDATAELRLQPLRSLDASVSLVTSRDLLPPEDAVRDSAVHPLLARERASLAGIDLGWETNRSLQTQLGFRPELAGWLRTSFRVTTNYGTDRNAALVERTVVGEDTTLALQRNANSRRDVRTTVGLEPARLVASAWGEEESDADPGVLESSIRTLASALQPLDVTWSSGVDSRFNRKTIEPGFGYRWGWGGIRDFRFLDGDTASNASERESWNARSGLNLPLNVSVALDYTRSENRSLDTRSERFSRSEGWPNVAVRVTELPIPTAIRDIVTRASLSTGYQVRTTFSAYGQEGDSQQERTSEDVQVPLDLTLNLLGQVNASYRGSLQSGEGVDPTGRTERERATHNVSVSTFFDPPGSLGEKLTRPIQVSLRYNYASQTDCRQTSSNEECVAFVDQVTRGFDLTLDTTIQDLNVGLQANYSDRQSFTGQRNGQSQFQLNLFGQFNFQAGRIR